MGALMAKARGRTLMDARTPGNTRAAKCSAHVKDVGHWLLSKKMEVRGFTALSYSRLCLPGHGYFMAFAQQAFTY